MLCCLSISLSTQPPACWIEPHTWLPVGSHLAPTWLPPDLYLASTRLLPEFHLASIWPPFGPHLASTWPPLGPHLAATWPLPGSHLDPTWTQVIHVCVLVLVLPKADAKVMWWQSFMWRWLQEALGQGDGRGAEGCRAPELSPARIRQPSTVPHGRAPSPDPDHRLPSFPQSFCTNGRWPLGCAGGKGRALAGSAPADLPQQTWAL